MYIIFFLLLLCTVETFFSVPNLPASGLDLVKIIPDLMLFFTAPLPGNHVAVSFHYTDTNTYVVVRLDQHGELVNYLYNCTSCNIIMGLFMLGEYLFVSHENGTVVQMDPEDGFIFQVYQIQGYTDLMNAGSLFNDPLSIDPDLLLFAGHATGHVLSYNIKTHTKQVHLTGFDIPRGVSYVIENGKVFYLVTLYGSHTINLYDDMWNLVTTFGGQGSADGQFQHPTGAVMSNNRTLIVADYGNHRVSEFTLQGKFLRHLITVADGLRYPHGVAASCSHMWIPALERHNNDNDGGRLIRYSF